MIGFLSSVWKGQNHFIFLLKFRIHLRATIILATISVFCCLGFNGSESVSLIISIWEHLKIQCNAIAAVGGSSCLWGISGMKVQILFWNTTDIFPSREHLFFQGLFFYVTWAWLLILFQSMGWWFWILWYYKQSYQCMH